jgi:hypothetical protein
MKVRILFWLFIASLACASVSDGQQRRAKQGHHCDCGDICTKVAPSEKCKVKDCNGAGTRWAQKDQPKR